MKIRQVILSPDLLGSIVVAAGTNIVLPPLVKIGFFINAYMVGITVLAIIFSLFIAAIAFVMTSSDDEYILILADLGIYAELRSIFEYTLCVFFVSLLYSITAYIVSDYFRNLYDEPYLGHKFFFSLFVFFFLYSLLATIPALRHTIQFAQRRSDFLQARRDKKKTSEASTSPKV